MNNKEKLKALKEEIINSVNLYNELNPNNKIIIYQEKSIYDIRDTFVCLYNDNKVGLFKVSKWHSTGKFEGYETGLFFHGIDSIHLGSIRLSWKGVPCFKHQTIGEFLGSGKNKKMITCEINNYMSFDEMRSFMVQQSVIESYELGKATNIEYIKVLKFAAKYYETDSKIKQY